MTRKYARDNRGRFASTGTGATARGGRLKTAAGNKRATQTITAGSKAGVLRKPPLPNNTPASAAKTGAGARAGGTRQTIKVKTKQAAYRSAIAESNALDKQSQKYGYRNTPYNPKNFFGTNNETRAANMAKASPEKLVEYKSLKQASDKFNRDRSRIGKQATEASNKAFYAKKAAASARPGTMLKFRRR